MMKQPEISKQADHPGVIVQQELDKRGITQSDFAFMAGRPMDLIAIDIFF